jgi:hypothetical protein
MELFCDDIISLECRGNTHQCKQSDYLMFIHSYYISQIHSHIIISKDVISNISGCTVHISPKEVLLDDYIVTLKVIEL